jgi:hypothetical protein
LEVIDSLNSDVVNQALSQLTQELLVTVLYYSSAVVPVVELKLVVEAVVVVSFIEMMLFLILEHILILLEMVELQLPFQVLGNLDQKEIMVGIVQ